MICNFFPSDLSNGAIETSEEIKTSIKKLIDDDNSSYEKELALTTFLLLYTAITGRNGYNTLY